MKTRNGYVSNSSSSSFLIPTELKGRVECIELPKEIWQAIARNHVEWDGKKLDLSGSSRWWLTDMVSDCAEEYGELSQMPHAVPYLEGNDMPYGCYEDDADINFIKFTKNGCDFYVLASDFIDECGKKDIPDAVSLRIDANTILQSKSLNKTQKINALKKLFGF